MPKHYFNRLEYLDFLIQKKGTGTPVQLAEKLQVCNRTIFEYIEILKELGAEIKYDSKSQTYFYEAPGGFNFKFIKEQKS